VIAFLALGKL
jgi:hypothetical protein